MNRTGNASGFALPHSAVYLLMTANIVIYGLCYYRSGSVSIPGPLLFQQGAMYSAAIARHEYWRLVANGFLHLDLVHLTTNMICLALWGGPLEKRVGAANFFIIYICSVIGGAVVSNLTQPTPYLAVGASGGTSGILGALLGLWILGKIGVPASFFVTNIGLNIALTLSVSRIDWRAHVGGFVAGLIACAILDLVAKANSVFLRCKFPEFIKVNLLLVACVVGLIWWGGQPIALPGESRGKVAAPGMGAGLFNRHQARRFRAGAQTRTSRRRPCLVRAECRIGDPCLGHPAFNAVVGLRGVSPARDCLDRRSRPRDLRR